METALREGDRIAGRYAVHRIVGGERRHGGIASGMGIVYVVHDPVDGAVYALKTFQDRYLAMPGVREAFRAEALTWVDLGRHPFIVQARRVEQVGSRLYAVVEYVAPDSRGRNCLSHHLRSGIALPLPTTLRWAIQICLGLEHGYGRRIVCHRDIKPDNVMITADGTAKVTDFGLAAVVNAVAPGFSTVTDAGISLGAAGSRVGKGVVCGTPGYRAPEVRAGHGADVRSDIFSFGVVLYQMVTGEHTSPLLVRGEESMPVARVPVPESPLWPTIRRCLHEHLRERPASFVSLRAELERLLRDTGAEPVRLPTEREADAREWNERGVSLNYLGRYQDAIESLTRALASTEGRFRAMVSNNLGWAYQRLGDHGLAIRHYDEALELDPSNDLALLNKAVMLFARGDFEGALSLQERATVAVPSSPVAWNNRGRTLLALERFDDAARSCQRALELDSRYHLALGNLGGVRAAQGDHDAAIESFDRALALEPLDAEILNAKALSLLARGRRAEARQCLETAVRIAPGVAVVWNNLGRVLLELGAHREALDAFACARARRR